MSWTLKNREVYSGENKSINTEAEHTHMYVRKAQFE